MNSNRSFQRPAALVIVLALLFVGSEAYFVYANAQAGSEPWQAAINALLLGLPLGLLYGGIGLMATAWQQKRREGHIRPRLAKIIHLAPRIAGVLIIVFVSLFALDVFDMPGTFWEKLGGFVLHILPSIAMAILLALAWRLPAVGFFAFLSASILFLAFVVNSMPVLAIGNLLLFNLPMLLIALLFWADWKWLPGL